MVTNALHVPPPPPPDALASLGSIAEVCDVLRGWGRADLAERLAYLATDEDLDDGDFPASLESALGFLAFFGAVESEDGKVDLGMSREGEICADWRFPDNRIVALWFVDREHVRCAARKADGYFFDVKTSGEVGNLLQITKQLVDMKQWFTWFEDNPVAMNSRLHIT